MNTKKNNPGSVIRWVERSPEHDFESFCLESARRIFSEKSSVEPSLCLCGPTGGMVCDPMPSGIRRKNIFGTAVSYVIRRQMGRGGGRGVGVIAEVWLTDAIVDVNDSHLISARRCEAIIVVIEHYELFGGEQRIWRAEIIRDGEASRLGEFAFFDGETGSVITGGNRFLPPKTFVERRAGKKSN